jgi:NAD(P)H dehydrogenase (quinone)
MKNIAADILTKQGHSVTISDLYGQGFSAVAQKWDFVTTSGGHFNYMLEQKHAAALDMAFSPDIVGEIQKVRESEAVLFITPIWWFGVPAIMKGWFDRVLAMGVMWDSDKIYERGLMRGKQAMLIASAGHPANFYQENGRHKTSIQQTLHPINFGTLAFCGFNVHEPFVAMGTLGMDKAGYEKVLKDIQFRIERFTQSPQWLVYYG